MKLVVKVTSSTKVGSKMRNHIMLEVPKIHGPCPGIKEENNCAMLLSLFL